MATYEEYLKKKLKQGKAPLTYEEWLKKVGVAADNNDAEVVITAGADGEVGTIDDVVTFVPSELSEPEVAVVVVDEPAPDLRTPTEKKRDEHLAKFWAAKKGGAA